MNGSPVIDTVRRLIEKERSSLACARDYNGNFNVLRLFSIVVAARDR